MKTETPRVWLSSLRYTRKPYRSEDVVDFIDCSKLLYTRIDTLNYLPFIDIKRFTQGFFTDVFAQHKSSDDEFRTIYSPQYWITKDDDTYYLINNEGYDYARYVVELRNYSRKTKENYIPIEVQ